MTATDLDLIRLGMPIAKAVQRVRGNRRVTRRVSTDEQPLDQPVPDDSDEAVTDYPLVHEEHGEPPPPLSARLRDPRTIVSIAVPIVMLVLIAAAVGNINFELLIQSIALPTRGSCWPAFVVYYLGFPLRG